jgi:HAD superfamily hydrolase (TIGR01509 family)
MSAPSHAGLPPTVSGPAHTVLFDFNGTLCNDERIVFEIARGIARDYFGRDLSESEYFSTLVGLSDNDILNALRATDHQRVAVGLAQLRAELRDRYVSEVRRTEVVMPGTQELLRQLSDRGTRLAIVTGAQRSQVLPVLNAAGIAGYFETIVAMEDVDDGKPHPAGYLMAIARLGLTGADGVVAFEDSVAGLRAARRAGLTTVAVTGSHPVAVLRDEADFMVDRLGPIALSLPPFSLGR